MFLLITSLVALSLGFLTITQKRKRFLYLFLTVLCLNEFLFFIFVFIAKKGGIPEELIVFFYFNDEIKNHFRDMILTLGQLGYLMSLGRFLFPILMLIFTLKVIYPHDPRQKKIIALAAICPVVSLVLYLPSLFKIMPYQLQSAIMWFSLIWIIGYCLSVIGLLIVDMIMIRPAISQLKYFAVNIFGCFLTIVYLLYCTQDGAQIYGFYSYDLPWTVGLLYLRMMMSEGQYKILIAVYGLLAAGGIGSLYLYISDIFELRREQVVLMNRNKTAVPATHIFVHGLKNHLLVEQAFIKKADRNYEAGDYGELASNLKELKKNNQEILTHLDDLYKAFRYDHIDLQRNSLDEIIEKTIADFKIRCPQTPEVTVNKDINVGVLSDKKLLSEAFCNLLVNSFEAMQNQEQKKISIVMRTGMFNVHISFIDNGSGLSDKEMKQIFYPFTTKKNSATNWGVGLYFTNEVIKQHSGKIFVESEIGKGTTFKVILPKRKGF